MEFERKPLSLLELCVRTVIDNLRYVGSMDGVEMQLLKRILPHCTLDQLTRIESCTEMDISPVTDVLWKRFYQRQFGEDNTNLVVKKMKQSGVHYKWKDLFKAKTEKQKEVEDMMVEKLTKKYQAEKAGVAYEPCTYQEGNWHPRVATDHVRGTCDSRANKHLGFCFITYSSRGTRHVVLFEVFGRLMVKIMMIQYVVAVVLSWRHVLSLIWISRMLFLMVIYIRTFTCSHLQLLRAPTGYVCRLRHALYGTAWFERFGSTIHAVGFSPSENDPTLLIHILSAWSIYFSSMLRYADC